MLLLFSRVEHSKFQKYMFAIFLSLLESWCSTYRKNYDIINEPSNPDCFTSYFSCLPHNNRVWGVKNNSFLFSMRENLFIFFSLTSFFYRSKGSIWFDNFSASRNLYRMRIIRRYWHEEEQGGIRRWWWWIHITVWWLITQDRMME